MLGIPGPSIPLPTGFVLDGRLEVGSPLGGQACNSYAARDLDSGDEVVVKLLEAVSADLDMERVRASVLPLQALDAAFAPRVLELVEFRLRDRRCAALVQERLAGQSLFERVKRRGLLSPDEAKPIARRLLEILRHLSRLDDVVVHGDINPHNLLLVGDRGRVALVDWAGPKAAARDWSSDRFGPEGWSLAVQHDFAAPEVPMGSPNPRSDLYGVGACALFALTGRTPDEVRDLDPRRVLELALARAHIPRAWIRLLVPLLEPTLERRLESPQHALEILVNPSAALSRDGGAQPVVERVDWHLEPRPDAGERWSVLGVVFAVAAALPLLASALGVVVPVAFGMKAWVVAARFVFGLVLAGLAVAVIRAGLRRISGLGRTRLQGLGRCLRLRHGDRRVEIPWLQITQVRRVGPLLLVRGAWWEHPSPLPRRRTVWLAPVYDVDLDTVAVRLGAHRARAASLLPSGHQAPESAIRWRPGWNLALPAGFAMVVFVALSGRCGGLEPVPDEGAFHTPVLALERGDRDPRDPVQTGGLEARLATLAEWASVRPAVTSEDARRLALDGLALVLPVGGVGESEARRSFERALAQVSDKPLPVRDVPSFPNAGGDASNPVGGAAAPSFVPRFEQAVHPLAEEPTTQPESVEVGAVEPVGVDDPPPRGFPCPRGMQRRILADRSLLAPACVDAHGTMVRVAGSGGRGVVLVDWTEVTVRDYASCVVEGACTAAIEGPGCHGVSSTRADYPVNCVDRDQAIAYCAWSGRRLCTEGEHARSARGNEGAPYPWGDAPPDCGRLIMDGRGGEGVGDAPGCGRGSAWPVGSRPMGVSPVGTLDSSGNVAEWVLGDPGGAAGGSYMDRAPEELQAGSLRPVPGDLPLPDVGFRCCRDGVGE